MSQKQLTLLAMVQVPLHIFHSLELELQAQKYLSDDSIVRNVVAIGHRA